MSREIASAINNLPGTPKNLDTWDEQKKAILNYYDKHVAKPFATQYGISEDFVKKQAEKMLANNKVANLKDTFLESNSTFTAIVAFNQSN